MWRSAHQVDESAGFRPRPCEWDKPVIRTPPSPGIASAG